MPDRPHPGRPGVFVKIEWPKGYETSNETGRAPWEQERPPFAKPRCWHCQRELEPSITVGLGAAGTQRRRYTVGCSCKPGLQESVILDQHDPPLAGFCYAFEPAGAR